MRLSDVLSGYLNNMVEIFLETGFYEGLLRSVSDSFITIQTSSGYDNSIVNVVIAKIIYLRVLNPS
jgi:hypothetical protein